MCLLGVSLVGSVVGECDWVGCKELIQMSMENTPIKTDPPCGDVALSKHIIHRSPSKTISVKTFGFLLLILMSSGGRFKTYHQ